MRDRVDRHKIVEHDSENQKSKICLLTGGPTGRHVSRSLFKSNWDKRILQWRANVIHKGMDTYAKALP